MSTKFIAIGFALVIIAQIALVQAQQVVPQPGPLPRELEEYYWDLRIANNYWCTSVMCGCPPTNNLGYILRSRSIFSPYKEFEWLKFSINHDAGKFDTPSSQLAKKYLMDNVINPILRYKAIQLQTGDVITAEDLEVKYARLNLDREKLDRLVIAELLFLYVREYVYFPPVDIENKRYEESYVYASPYCNNLANSMSMGGAGGGKQMLLAMGGFPHVIPFPAEEISMQLGICWQQTTALAALYEIMDYDLAMYLVPAAPCCSPMQCFMGHPAGEYHAILLLRDEGWGIATFQPGKDALGNRLDGEYLMLDPMYDWTRASSQQLAMMQMQMSGTPQGGDLDALPGVYGFLEPSPYTSTMMPLMICMDCIPCVQARFIGKI